MLKRLLVLLLLTLPFSPAGVAAQTHGHGSAASEPGGFKSRTEFSRAIQIVAASVDAIPRQLRRTHHWQVAEGRGVSVYYLPGRSNRPILLKRKIDAFDWALRQVYRVLQVQPLAFKVPIFLFRDPASLGKILGTGEPFDGGMTLIKTVLISDTRLLTVPELKCLAVHELTHVVGHYRLGGNTLGIPTPAFFKEGLAVYTQNAVPETAFTTEGAPAPHITMKQPLRTIVEADSREFDYSHAGAFIGYLAMLDGGEADRLKAFLNAISTWQVGDKPGGPGSHTQLVRVERACQSVYGMSLSELEAAWREESRSNSHPVEGRE